ncbi:sigma 54-interacting transcriptional regulator [bacterium]|nr:sigma 54-interacting transcriptional regulator [bacterium]NUM76839.1 sigma 54-interacting transcriptional regulator [candidate division KSB1 bacterium]RIK77093.1 MAG: sigma-54-dependent Fis family transcriptional regulator [candidate division KSB1 bacterium]
MTNFSERNLGDVLSALSRISAIINTMRELDPLLEKIMDIAVETVGAERGFILLNNETGELAARTARNISAQNIQDITDISNSVVRDVLQRGDAVISYDAQADEQWRNSESIILNRIQSVACVPLAIKQKPIGVIYLDSIQQRSGFTETSVPFLNAFANQAAIAIENAQLYEALREENRHLRKQARESSAFEGIIGQSPKMKHVFDMMNSVLDSDATVLIQGESGTGKELVARALHYNGSRRDKPFIALFCGSLPETLLESELFGHKKGAFTGAIADKKGLFESAHGGTFFLDEIGDLSPNIQTQLLRVLQEGEIKRVGENQVRKVDVRIIAATNKNLAEAVKKSEFREDLYYRLNVINLFMPPLRQRAKDVPLLAHHFLRKYAVKNRKEIAGFTPEALDLLTGYSWPGNVRELENTVERAVVLAKGTYLSAEDLRLQEAARELFLPQGMTLEEMERRLVEKTLDEVDNNITHAADRLGVSRRWIHYKMKQWQNGRN